MPAMQFGGLIAPHALFIDRNGWCKYASPQLARLLKTTQAALLDFGWMAYLDGREMAQDEWRLRHERAISFMLAHSLVLQAGDPTRGFYTHFMRHLDIHGEHVGYVGFVQDVTVEMFKAARYRAAHAAKSAKEQIG